jgi:hypothetical protein
MKNGQLRVWWIPQVPMKSFNILVNDLKEAKLLLDVLAEYDMFQLVNNIKPDFCNTGGLQIWDETLEIDEEEEKWCDWYDEETGDDFDTYCENNLELNNNRAIKT